MSINKETRQKVYAKYNGRCAYCGQKIEYKDMQIDHLIPKQQAEYGKADWQEVENENNYMPSCRRCNHYKRSSSLETFRKMISEIPKKLYRDNYIYKVGVAYGNVIENEKPIEFYFERVKGGVGE